jgi:hypothetical protein
MKHIIPGFIELHGIPRDVLENIEVGDSIIDNNGKGRSVCVDECDICGKKIYSTMRYFVPVLCNNCSSYRCDVEC